MDDFRIENGLIRPNEIKDLPEVMNRPASAARGDGGMMENVTIETMTKHFPDLDFTVVAEVHDYRVDFKVYEISGYEEGDTKGVYDKPVWRKAGAISSGHVVDALEESEVYLSGHVRQDGCSNWRFDEQDRCMLHGCSKANVQRFGDIMAACWDWASELCPNWMD